MANIKRIRQILQYGWMHAGEISRDHFSCRKRVHLFFDILSCYCKYGMWSNQYLKERFWALSTDERIAIGVKYQQANSKKELWLKDFYKDRDFFNRYGSVKYERPLLRERRNKVYSERYNAGKGLLVEYDVEISRQHYLDGSISIGDNVLLAKHVFIDYSGVVVLENEVKLSAGVVIESHRHIFTPGSNKYEAVPSKVLIEKGVWIGQGALICESAKRIGRFAQIGAGAVVRTSVPPYAIVIGNPAKIIGFVLTPEEVEIFESKNNLENPLDIEGFRSEYENSFINRIEVIKQITKLRG